MPRAVRTTSVEEQIIGYFRNAHLQTALAVLNIARGEVQARMPKPAVEKGPATQQAAPKKRVRRTKAEMETAKKLSGAFISGARGNAHAHEGAEEEV